MQATLCNIHKTCQIIRLPNKCTKVCILCFSIMDTQTQKTVQVVFIDNNNTR